MTRQHFAAKASPRCINARQQGRQQQLRVVSRAAVQTRNGRHTATGPTAAVTFKTRKQLPYGQVLKLVGSMPAMGEWDCDSAPVMTWVEGDYWLLTLDLPAGEHEFKVVAASSGSGTCSTDWEAGPNRAVLVPETEAATRGAFTVVWEWGNPKTLAEEEHDMAELKQLMEQLEKGWHEDAGKTDSGKQHTQRLQQLSGLLEAERVARRAAEAERDELRRQADSAAAEASVLVRNSGSLRVEFEQLARELGTTQEQRAQLQAERDSLAHELSASYEQRTALQRERDALAEQLWRAGEQRAQVAPERDALDSRLRTAEQQVKNLQAECDRLGKELWHASEAKAALQTERDSLHQKMYSSTEPTGQLRQERDALASQLRTAREQLEGTQAELRRMQQELDGAMEKTKLLRSMGLLLCSMD
ncbi:hypothetical protein D9Q98_003149 [Chlorella vulgaris]|uniref:CBM20 domain-containing protein n=1 Tax=Chlorella vulgaris TaxID=3077 RepID=A0A9D4TSA0_CHLVU|nr:hypothetical protein D9Q98_003149 [Chlorella vulgaris]